MYSGANSAHNTTKGDVMRNKKKAAKNCGNKNKTESDCK